MIPKNKNPLIDSPFINEKKLNEWRKAFDENQQHRNEEFQKAYRTLRRSKKVFNKERTQNELE